jgi:hypothetical protein
MLFSNGAKGNGEIWRDGTREMFVKNRTAEVVQHSPKYAKAL